MTEHRVVLSYADVRVYPQRLLQFIKWAEPRRIRISSDMFHEDLPVAWIAACFAYMSVAYWHTYLVCTTRHDRLKILSDQKFLNLFLEFRWDAIHHLVNSIGLHNYLDYRISQVISTPPLPNVHLGVSCDDQERAEVRIPAVLDAPAYIRWIFVELHAPITLREQWLDLLDWVESGPAARPFDLVWAEQLVEQCRAWAVPVFVKQIPNPKGGRPLTKLEDFPESLRYQEMPANTTAEPYDWMLLSKPKRLAHRHPHWAAHTPITATMRAEHEGYQPRAMPRMEEPSAWDFDALPDDHGFVRPKRNGSVIGAPNAMVPEFLMPGFVAAVERGFEEMGQGNVGRIITLDNSTGEWLCRPADHPFDHATEQRMLFCYETQPTGDVALVRWDGERYR